MAEDSGLRENTKTTKRPSLPAQSPTDSSVTPKSARTLPTEIIARILSNVEDPPASWMTLSSSFFDLIGQRVYRQLEYSFIARISVSSTVTSSIKSKNNHLKFTRFSKSQNGDIKPRGVAGRDKLLMKTQVVLVRANSLKVHQSSSVMQLLPDLRTLRIYLPQTDWRADGFAKNLATFCGKLKTIVFRNFTPSSDFDQSWVPESVTKCVWEINTLSCWHHKACVPKGKTDLYVIFSTKTPFVRINHTTRCHNRTLPPTFPHVISPTMHEFVLGLATSLSSWKGNITIVNAGSLSKVLAQVDVWDEKIVQAKFENAFRHYFIYNIALTQEQDGPMDELDAVRFVGMGQYVDEEDWQDVFDEDEVKEWMGGKVGTQSVFDEVN